MGYINEILSFEFFNNSYIPLIGQIALYLGILGIVWLICIFIYSFLPRTNFIDMVLVIPFIVILIGVIILICMAVVCPLYGLSIWIKTLLLKITITHESFVGLVSVVLSATVLVLIYELLLKVKSK